MSNTTLSRILRSFRSRTTTRSYPPPSSLGTPIVRMASRSSHSARSRFNLTAFYEDSIPDYKGRYLADILRWSDKRLESSHDYIQLVFPLPEASGVNWNAPVIDRPVFNAFRARPELRDRLRDSYLRILRFYGFEVLELDDGEGFKIVKSDNFSDAAENWRRPFDHNHLRITRIIRSLRVLGLEREAQEFHNALFKACVHMDGKKVSDKSLMFWRRAVERPLNIAPELDDLEADDTDSRIGPKFLWEFEEERRQKEQHVDDIETGSEEKTTESDGVEQPDDTSLEGKGKPGEPEPDKAESTKEESEDKL